MISEERRKILRERTKKCSEVLRKKRKENNLCVMCGGKLNSINQYRCLPCKKKHNKDSKRRLSMFVEKGLCRICQQPLDDSGNKNHCKKCNKLDKQRRNKNTHNSKKRCVDYLGGKCSVCGLKTDFLAVYDFHHRNPNEKETGIRNLLHNSWEKLEKELNKCILVCSNCHRIIHFEGNNK